MMALQRPGRTAAVVGAVVAVSATTLMAFAGTALARVPGTCTETVNVRAEPSIDSRIVAVCEAGTAVETGATRDGFVRIMDLGGWASAQYVSIDGAAPASTGPAPGATSPSTGTAPSTGPSTRPTPADEDADDTTGSGDELRQEPTGGEPSTTGRDAAGSGTGGESPGRSSFTPEDSDPPAGPADDDEDGPGLGGGLL